MKLLTPKNILLSVQHLFAMFGATVLVPLLTGLDPAVALVSAGIGTFIFHICTEFKVPVFLGSSFAFIPAISAVVANQGIPYAQGGIIFAGLLYIVFAVIVSIVGAERVKRFFPPVVTGSVIVVIGINLSTVAINDATSFADLSAGVTPDALLSIGIAMFTLLVVVITSVFSKGFFRLVPILMGILSGYVLCLILNAMGIYTMDFSAIEQAAWINIPFVTDNFFTLPQFDMGAILSIAPIAMVTVMEHIGDITTNGAVVGKNFFQSPGLHRTLMGDGFATLFAGLIGGPANTTYSENTGVLATTKNYDPALLRMTAVIAILLGFLGKLGAVLQTIPSPVKGGVEIILFGMIASIGIRTLAESKLDFTHSRNLTIVGLILVFGLGVSGLGGIGLTFGTISLNVSGLFVATVVGVLANALMPLREDA